MSSRERPIDRRAFLKGVALGGAAAVGGCTGVPLPFGDNGLTAAVAILKADSYSDDLVGIVRAGFDLVPPPDVSGKTVLLKVNMVDLPRDNRPVTTNPAMMVAAAEAFRAIGAAEVIIADGPALQRDAWEIADAIGLTPLLDEYGLPFVDLNLDEGVAVANQGGLLQDRQLVLARTVMQADVVVTMPKLKVHHWLGASLSLKSMFGILPGHVYGWPRNHFHLQDPNKAVIDFNLTRPADYAIIDGIVGLQGDGPIMGDPVQVGAIIMGANLTAVDVTGVRVMRLSPGGIDYLTRAVGLLGPGQRQNIEQRGETIESVQTRFNILPHQQHLQV